MEKPEVVIPMPIPAVEPQPAAKERKSFRIRSGVRAGAPSNASRAAHDVAL